MSREIPYLFNGITISSPLSPLNDLDKKLNVGRAKVRVFTKYANRNGSYITEAVAKQLIDSATSGMVPVVGFFDKQTGDWTTHLGPDLASGYGYVDKFEGWEKATDTDGVEREYATFSVVLFSDYFDEAKNIIGKNQSMELDVNSIDGEWAPIDGDEYFIYSTAKMRGFCILGDDVEPCFSSSAFFTNSSSEEKTNFDKFSALLLELKEKVENIEKGGVPMDNFNTPVEEQVVVEEQIETQTSEFEEAVVETEAQEIVASEEVASDFEEIQTEDAVTDNAEEAEAEFEQIVEENIEEEVVEELVETVSENEAVFAELEQLRTQFEELQTNFNDLQTRYSTMETEQTNYVAQIESLNTQLTEANATIAEYQAQARVIEAERKAELIGNYEEMLSNDEILEIRDRVDDFTYEELESKLAVTFARNNMREHNSVLRAPVVQVEESDFEKLMKNYKR